METQAKIIVKVYNYKLIGFVWQYILCELIKFWQRPLASWWNAKTIRPHKMYLHTNPDTYKYVCEQQNLLQDLLTITLVL